MIDELLPHYRLHKYCIAITSQVGGDVDTISGVAVTPCSPRPAQLTADAAGCVGIRSDAGNLINIISMPAVAIAVSAYSANIRPLQDV